MKHTQTHCAEIYCEIRKPDDEDDNGDEKKLNIIKIGMIWDRDRERGREREQMVWLIKNMLDIDS